MCVYRFVGRIDFANQNRLLFSSQEENRNLNRVKQQNKKKAQDGSDEAEPKTYRGPDRGKGGRAIGPDGKYLPRKKGGKKGKAKEQQQQQDNSGDKTKKAGTSTEKGATGDKQTKIQQKRKNQNKAKIANHHRKERAQKKASI